MDYQSLALFLAGIVVSGAAMLLRGDFLGGKAAKDVESRLSVRIDREMALISSELEQIRQAMVRLEEKL